MDWNEVKAKPKRQAKKHNDEEYQGFYGAAQSVNKTSGGGMFSGKTAEHHASTIADADYLRDEDEEIKIETISHVCSQAV